MILPIYTLYDEKTEQHNKPFYFTTENECKRAMVTTVNSGDSLLQKYPGDYTLYHVGDFNTETAEIKSIAPIKLVSKLDAFVIHHVEEAIQNDSKNEQ